MFINYGDACLRTTDAAADAAAAYALGAAAGLFAHPLQRPVHEVANRKTPQLLEEPPAVCPKQSITTKHKTFFF